MTNQHSTTKKIFGIGILPLLFTLLALVVIGKQTSEFESGRSPLPEPTSVVMDYAGVIDSETEDRIRKKINDFAESSNPRVEFGVAVVDSTGDVPIFDYSLAVARGWGIGTTKDDNPGALLFVAVKDRKYFTQISFDLEDELSDGTVGSIQRRLLVPEFRKGNYGKGIEDTIDAYIETVRASQAGEPNPYQSEDSGETAPAYDSGPDNGDMICCLAGGIFFIVFLVWGAMHKKSGGGGSGGTGSGVGEAAIDIATGLILGALSGGGSGGSSGSSWGGGSGGGGFSGGGSFGGGGSGGSW